MDSLTHIALGACIGEAFFEKGFGKKAMIWGALAQSIPDIDFVAAFWLNPAENLIAHRGITHSLLFAILIVPAFAVTANKVHQPHNISFKKWLLFFATEVCVHLFIDGFNNYGVGWFEPFMHTRYSFNAIYVADPLFSIGPAIALVVLIFLHSYSSKRTFWWKFGIFLPLIYLGYCTFNKAKIDMEAKEIFASQQIPHNEYFTTPAPLQNWLWFVVAGNDSGFYVGFRSLFDDKKKINFQYFPRNDSLLTQLADQDDVKKLLRFSQHKYTVEKWHDTLVFNDLRFGQILGWENPREKFVFHYFLRQDADNKYVVQRGRFAQWNWQVVKNFLRRIEGN